MKSANSIIIFIYLAYFTNSLLLATCGINFINCTKQTDVAENALNPLRPIVLTDSDLTSESAEKSNKIKSELNEVIKLDAQMDDSINIFDEIGTEDINNEKSWWQFITGKPARNSMLLSMFSHHTHRGAGYNEKHNLLGLDYSGYSVGTFKNSFSDQAYYAGISREIYERDLVDNVKLDIKYKFILMHGYGDTYPNLYGVTPVIMPMFGLTKGVVGVDFMAIPSNKPIFTINFRVSVPN